MPRDSDRDYSHSRRDHNDSGSRDVRRDYHSDRSYPKEQPRRNEASSSYRREENRYGYSQEERERERRRDRERYDRNDKERDSDSRKRSSRKRSESPRSRRRSRSPRSPHSRSHSHSRSASRSKSPVNKAKPNFGSSGLLAAETNTVQSVDGKNSTVLKYNEPPEARRPVLGWRLYVFKGEEILEVLHIQRQSAYLIGRDRLVADIPIEHPSCSKQHAVIQHRLVQEKDEYGGSKGVVKPFIIDLESANGTHVNGDKVPASRYYELKLNDMIKFGTSNREYVLLHEDAS